MKVLVYGSLNIDLVFSVDHIASGGETISSNSLVKSAGGKGANQAAALAKAGLPVYMAGKIGKDGLFLTELLRSYGVNTDNVVQYEGATGQAIIQLDKNSQNAILLYGGGNMEVSIEEIEKTTAQFGNGDMIVLQNEIAHIREIMENAKKRGMKICFNPSPFNEKIEALPLELVDLLFVNEIEGAALASLRSASKRKFIVDAAQARLALADMQTGETSAPAVLDKLVKRFPKTEIILTAGKDGAHYACAEARARGEIVEVEVKDTTAAGDTFTGYFIAARTQGMPVPQALAAACKASSIAVSRMGAMESIPLKNEVFGL